MLHVLNRLVHGDEGQDLIEYGLLAAVISLSAIATILVIGQAVETNYGKINPSLEAVP
jgi:Flp pilus assembly pilin Flp